MKIVTVIGARPQFIKAAAVSRVLRTNDAIHEVLVHTGQHFDDNMSQIFFRELDIPYPDYNLNINSMSHGAMTGRMLEKLEEVIIKEQPEYVMVYGDTNSTLAGALSAKKLHVKVVHIEAGLRSFNMCMPEEINRILADRISDILCCPTKSAVDNLILEGFENYSCEISRTGDVMQDAAIYYSRVSSDRSGIIEKLGLADRSYALCTVHRAENTDDPKRLTAIVEALNEISRDVTVILPLHPRTRGLLATLPVKLTFAPIDPVGYFDMLELLKNTSLVLTDSGGLQKEAYFFAKPCITLRDETEWIELIDAGCNVLAGADKECILSSYQSMHNCAADFSIDLYGNGKASDNIMNVLTKHHARR